VQVVFANGWLNTAEKREKMKKTISSILLAIVIVCAVFMVVSFFWQFPQPLVIADTIVLIVAIIAILVIDRDKKEK